MVRPRGITVEGEIGHIGRADDASAEVSVASAYSDPREELEYVRRTGAAGKS